MVTKCSKKLSYNTIDMDKNPDDINFYKCLFFQTKYLVMIDYLIDCCQIKTVIKTEN